MALLKFLAKHNKDELKELYTHIKSHEIVDVLIQQGVKALRPIQIEAIQKQLFLGRNFLICTPSGCGKTIIAELAIINNFIQKLGKAVYIVPYKALAGEKYRHFLRMYKHLNMRIVLSIGDFDADDDKLKDADLIITTFEKLDSLMRLRNNENGTSWFHQIATAIVDEVHVLGDPHRGFKLESLIIRLLQNYYDVQIICLSATISNPDNFCSWLNSLSEQYCTNTFTLIKSDWRPVRLDYQVQLVEQKDSWIRAKIKGVLSNRGQVLIFVTTRKKSVSNARKFANLTSRFLYNFDQNHLENQTDYLKKVQGGSEVLRSLLTKGIAYHNAGLTPQERHVVEKLYNQRALKVICCTTTLAAGVNTPARVVILRSFKQRVFPQQEVQKAIHDGTNKDSFQHLPGKTRGFFIPFSANQTFQLLGRAGRPGLDLIGEGVILVKNQEEQEWVLDYYFQNSTSSKELVPKYNPITSVFNNVGALREQILLLIHQGKRVSVEELKDFFQNTYFAYNYSHDVQLEHRLLLKNINVSTALYLHKGKSEIQRCAQSLSNMKIPILESDLVEVHFRMSGLYTLKFHLEHGIRCSCGYRLIPEEIEDYQNIRTNYTFCPHVIAFLSYILRTSNNETRVLIRYLNSILPNILKAERIAEYLLQEGFIIENNGLLSCTPLGSLTVQLYLRPMDMVYIRETLEEEKIESGSQLSDICVKFLQREGRYWSDQYPIAMNQWIQEIPIEEICKMKGVIPGDFYKLREDMNRALVYYGAVADFFGLKEVQEIAQEMQLRVKYGVKQELLDLVVKIKGVGRARGRKIYDAGYSRPSDLIRVTPHELHANTQIAIHICELIIKNVNK